MFTLCLKKDFIARHFLIGGDWGAENEPNSHRYVLELRLSAPDLDEHEYLVDLVEVEAHLDAVIGMYSEQMLNDMPSFAGRNPSLELFARILWDDLAARLADRGLSDLRVRLWEHESAWAQWGGAPGDSPGRAPGAPGAPNPPEAGSPR